jgi:hypothetical protein
MVSRSGAYLPIELSTMSWVIAFNTPLSEKISRRNRACEGVRRPACGDRVARAQALAELAQALAGSEGWLALILLY